MPKTKRKELIEVYESLLRRDEYKNEFIITEKSIEDKTLKCVKCSKHLKCIQKCDLDRHLVRPVHLASIKRLEQFSDNKSITQEQFNKILANFCSKLNIAFNKISEDVFISFIETFTKYKCPKL